MHGAGLLAFVILVGAATSACREGVGPPAPPPPPDLTGRVLPKPPGSDDFAHRSFGHPLSCRTRRPCCATPECSKLAGCRRRGRFRRSTWSSNRLMPSVVFARLPRASRQQESSTASQRFYCSIPPRRSR